MKQKNASQLLSISNLSLGLSTAILLISLIVAYNLPQLSITLQIIAHIVVTLSATAIKLAYLGRICAQRALNLRVC